jgi:hypothetical protein
MNRGVSIASLARRRRGPRRSSTARLAALGALGTLCGFGPPVAAGAATTPPPITEPTTWPALVTLGANRTLEIYPPQLEAWDGIHLQALAALVVRDGSATTRDAKDDHAQYGTAEFTARTIVDNGSRTVALDNFLVTRAEFPSAGPEASAWVDALRQDVASHERTVSLDRLQAALKVSNVDLTTSKLPLRNEPPAILFAMKPALLVTVDGAPRYVEAKGTGLQRVLNTRVLLLKDATGAHYLHVFDGWMTASSLQGAWAVLPGETADLRAVREEAERTNAADLLSGETAATQRDQPPEQGQPNPSTPPSLARGPVPAIHVATRPTELIVSDGEWSWVAIDGTQLLYVGNTTGHVFRSAADRDLYVLVAGRWFRSKSANGPWTFVAANALPADFARIPDDSDKENVKASVAGTGQAREAAIAATVPQTASVPVATTMLEAVRYDGAPSWQPIAGTTIAYASNTPTPLLRVDERDYYALENAIWFRGSAPDGPWVVARSVPASIYSIPPASPLHYVTYVRVYNATSETVYVGYTAGYQGSYVDPVSGVVVYGTGYEYEPWVGTVHIAAQPTYGYGASVTYTPWTGWTVGFCFGWAWGSATSAWGWGWGPYPYWGPWAYGWGYYWGGVAYGPYGGAAAWGPGGWAGYSGPIYQRRGDVQTASRYSGGFNAWTGNQWAGQSGVAYNSRTGRVSAGQRGVVENVYTGTFVAGGRGVTRGPDGVVAGGSRGTAGNIHTGETVSGGRGFVYDPETGQGTTFGGIRGDDGAIGRVGDDVYAGHDGNVYRNTGDGWQKHTGDGWETVTPPETSQNLSGDRDFEQLSRDRDARAEGAWRDQQYQRSTQDMSQRFGSGHVGGRTGGFQGGRMRRF